MDETKQITTAEETAEIPAVFETLPEITEQPVIEMQECCPIEETEPPKPYTFRRLGSKDLFLIMKIIKAIGLKEFKQCMDSAEVLGVIRNMSVEEMQEDSAAMMVGVSVFLEIADVICGNIGKCEKEIYQLLSDTTGIPVKEITAEGNAVIFFEMVLDFVQLPEFPDFIKAVSKRFF